MRTRLASVAAICAAAIGGGAIANAATSTTTSSTTSPSTSAATASAAPAAAGPQGRHSLNGKTEAALTGDVAAKVQAAALAKVPGTVERVETNVDSSAPYEAHIVKSDGTEVEVQVNSDYTVAAVNTMPGHP
jgi:uncharacterized secreted protein with C-terminal beta-propeller domain